MSALRVAARLRTSARLRPSRRGFLTSMSTLVAVGALPGCGGGGGGGDEDGPPPDPLEQFLALSRLLTAFDDLSETLAATYLDAVQADPAAAAALLEIYDAAGLGTDDAADSFEALEARGIFDDPQLAGVCDTVIRLWYTGVVVGPGGPVVVAYTENLAWRSLDYATAPTLCGGLVGFWADPPAAA